MGPEKGHENAQNLKILYLIDHLGNGGTQRFVLDILRRLDQRGWDVSLCSLRGPAELSSEAMGLGITVLHLGAKTWDPRQYFQLVRLLRRGRFDLVHIFSSASAIVGPLAARSASVKFVVVHDQNGPNVGSKLWGGPVASLKLGKRAYLLIDRSIQRHVSRVVVPSKAVAAYRKQTNRIPGGGFQLIPNFVDLSKVREHINAREEIRKELRIPKNALTVGTAGRLAPEKGQKEFLRAGALLTRTFPDIIFLLAGDGPLRGVLKDQASILGIADRVHFTGWRDDALRVVAGMDIFVLPSYQESFGLALIEAMALGKPVVASDVGGISDIVPSREFGLLVPPGHPQALASAIEELALDPGLKEATGLAGMQRIWELFSLDSVGPQIEHFYEDLFAESRKSLSYSPNRSS